MRHTPDIKHFLAYLLDWDLAKLGPVYIIVETETEADSGPPAPGVATL